MNLEKTNLIELSHQEMITIEGGGRIKVIIKAVKKAAHEIADFVVGLIDGFKD